MDHFQKILLPSNNVRKITIRTCASLHKGKVQHFHGILLRSMDREERRIAAIFLMLMYFLTETQGASVHHLCGVNLVETLLLVCEGKGLYYKNFKGPAPSPSHRFTERNKRKVGIVEKCCHQSCTLYDLQTYCKT